MTVYFVDIYVKSRHGAGISSHISSIKSCQIPIQAYNAKQTLDTLPISLSTRLTLSIHLIPLFQRYSPIHKTAVSIFQPHD
jgi:hypothetical protein